MSKLAVFLLSVFILVVGLQPANLATANGKAVYESKCSTCHGPDGKGKQNIADMFGIDISKLNLVDDETAKKSDAELTKIIHDGTGKFMKPFKDKLSGDEISAIVKYIRSLIK